MKRKWIIRGLLLLGFGIIAYYLFDKFYVPTTNSWNLPLSGRIIYIDPGHGGPDGGAESGNAVESEIALSISKKLRDFLQQQGALVLMTREEDVDLADDGTRGLSRRKVQDLHRRAELINSSEAEFFISIHLNSIPSSRWRGAQTFYNNRYVENKIAAEFIQSELVRNLENTDRKAKPIRDVYLIKTVTKPGALVEVGFLSNPQERDLLTKDSYQTKIAASIYEGILRYFTEKDKMLEQEKETN